MAYSRGENNIEIVRRMRFLRFGYGLREKWHYNNIVRFPYTMSTNPISSYDSLQQYMVAQHLVERFSGIDIGNFVASHIFAPLNMTTSTYSFEYATATGDLSESYEPNGRRISHWYNRGDASVTAGPGGVMSSTVDLLKWGKMLLGATNSTAVGIPREILDKCVAPESVVDTILDLTYGFGWFQSTIMGFKVSADPRSLTAVLNGSSDVQTLLILP
jgi:CubicO group peptidase (beta-lactamase class C family)